MTTKEVLTLFMADRVLIFLAFLIPFAAIVAFALTQPKQYRADARLLALPSTDYMLRPILGAASAGSTLDAKQIVAAEIELLQSATLKRQTIEVIGLARMFPEAAEAKGSNAVRLALAVDLFNRTYQTDSLPRTNSIRVSFAHPDPQIAAAALNDLIARYLDMRQRIFDRPRTAFLEEQTRGYAARLKDADAAMLAFQTRESVSSLREQIAETERRRIEARIALADIDATIADTQRQIDSLTASIATLPATIELYVEQAASPELESARASLLALEVRRRELSVKFTDDSPFIQDIDQQIATVRAHMATLAPRQTAGRRSGPNPVRQDLDGALISARAQLTGLIDRQVQAAQTVNDLEAALVRLNQVQAQYERLRRERDEAEKSYAYYSRVFSNISEADEAESRREPSVRLVQSAIPPQEGSDRRPLIVAAGFFISLLIAAIVAFVRSFLRDTYLMPEQAERGLGLPVLLSIGLREGPERGKVRA